MGLGQQTRPPRHRAPLRLSCVAGLGAREQCKGQAQARERVQCGPGQPQPSAAIAMCIAHNVQVASSTWTRVVCRFSMSVLQCAWHAFAQVAMRMTLCSCVMRRRRAFKSTRSSRSAGWRPKFWSLRLCELVALPARGVQATRWQAEREPEDIKAEREAILGQLMLADSKPHASGWCQHWHANSD